MIRSIVAALVALSAVVGSASLTQAQTAPTSPAATAAAVARGVPLHTLFAQGNPNVKVKRIDLSPTACASALVGVSPVLLNRARAEQCSMLLYSFQATHLPIPAGRNLLTGAPTVGIAAISSECCGFWYYSGSDELTDVVTGGIWNATLWYDGVANGTNVYYWDNFCTPGGIGVTINACFHNFNGGGPPYYGIQYGMDFCAGVTTGWISFCIQHGIRQWADDFGTDSTEYDW
jgi:hypothetical protein